MRDKPCNWCAVIVVGLFCLALVGLGHASYEAIVAYSAYLEALKIHQVNIQDAPFWGTDKPFTI